MLISATVQLKRCNVRLRQKKGTFFILNNLPSTRLYEKIAKMQPDEM